VAEKLSKEIISMLKAYVLAVPFVDGADPMSHFKPYPLHTGNFVMLEKDKPPVILTPRNYEKIEMKLFDKIVEHAKEMKNSLSTLFICMSSPYRIQFLHLIKDYITKEELSEQFEWIWVQTEFPHQYPVKMLLDLFKASDPNVLMNAEERAKFDELPDEIVIYRGLQATKAKAKGLSWTLNLEKAKWFANRWKKTNKIFKTTIKKKDVFALFTGRGEDEIIINPYKIKEIEEVPFEFKSDA